MSVTVPSSLVKSSVIPLMVTGRLVGETPIHSRACTPLIVHSSVSSWSVRHTRESAMTRLSKAPKSDWCALATPSLPRTSGPPGNWKWA